MRVITLISILTICTILVSCGNRLNEEQEKKLSRLEFRVDSTLDVINSIDTAKGLASANHFFENMEYIKTVMTDTIDRDMAFYIDKYYSTRKSFKYFGKEYPYVHRELTICKEQISNLRHDADNGILEEGQFEKYYHLESNNLILAEEAANEVVEAIDFVEPIYADMNPRIDSLINASKQNMQAAE